MTVGTSKAPRSPAGAFSFWECHPISNMKIIAMLDAQAREARADLTTALEVVEDEITPLQEKVKKLRDDVDELKKEK